MKNYVYVIFNNLSARYESVMSFPSDSMALHRLSSNIDKKEYSLCRVGSIDIETGVVEACAPVRLIWEESDVLPKQESK